MSASREQSGLPERYSIIIALVSMATLIAVVVAITTMVILHITDPKAEEKALMKDLRVRSVALDYARSNKFDLFTALMSRFSESSVLTSESELQRAYSLFYRQVRIDSAEDHAVNQRQWTPGMDVSLLVRVEPYNRSETLIDDTELLVWVWVIWNDYGDLVGHRITLPEQ